MSALVTAGEWLAPLRSTVPELSDQDWETLEVLDGLLAALTAEAPKDSRVPGSAGRGRWLLSVRARLAEHGLTFRTVAQEDGGAGRPAVLQPLLQFVCGFHDLDHRDATGLGHGAMALELASPTSRRHWLGELRAGGLVGIAATERHGGSRIRELTSRARCTDNGRWLLSGEKVWVSRLVEARAFAVFFRDPDDAMSAALVATNTRGLTAEPSMPSGLAGWTWGTLSFDDVVIDPSTALIGDVGGGADVFARHFASYRPLVTATALGAAAAAHTSVARALGARHNLGIIPRIRDNAYIVLGRSYGDITTALLAAVATSRLAGVDHPAAHHLACVGKASGVDIANRTVVDLLPLVGASGFEASSQLIKARNDLTALTYADGIHDGLYRATGRSLVDESPPSSRRTQSSSAGSAR